MTASVPELFREADLGPMKLKNRFIMGPMHVRLEEQEDGWRKLQAFYEERAANDVGCIVTGGYAPDRAGRFDDRAHVFSDVASRFQPIVRAVQAHGARFILQLLHTGRYGLHSRIEAPSAVRAPINHFTPAEMTEETILQTLANFAHATRCANDVGFDGVEIMGCEGYLVSQFLSSTTNHRADRWGGALEGRAKFAVELVRHVRAALGANRALLFRLSFIDLISDGLSWEDLAYVIRSLEAAGVDGFHAGIGWHEARVPTVSALVPDNAFGGLFRRVRELTSVPVIAAVKIHTRSAIEQVVREQRADFVSLARPFLADPGLVHKLATDSGVPVNTCVGCNQSCLDNVFLSKPVSCLVNPRAGNETRFDESVVFFPKRVLVVGGGPAGMIAAASAARRGHRVVLAEARGALGGLLRVAAKIPGKEKFNDTIAFYEHALSESGVDVRLGQRVDAAWVTANGFAEVVLATGTNPNPFRIPGDDGRYSSGYEQFLSGKHPGAAAVAVIGAGKIAIDVALYLTHGIWRAYSSFWGVDLNYADGGGRISPTRDPRNEPVTLLQRSSRSFRKELGPTTGWGIVEVLRASDVRIEAEVELKTMSADVLFYVQRERASSIRADHFVYCTGQVANDTLHKELLAAGVRARLIGSATGERRANAELAFLEGYRIGCSL